MSLLPLSVFHKILIYLEDNHACTFDQLRQFGTNRQVVGSLGRLEGLKLIERNSSTKPTLFSLSQTGDSYLFNRVSILPILPNKDQKIYVIILTSKASNRTVRYTIQSLLKQVGGVLLESGIWATPLNDHVEVLKQELELLKLSNTVFIFLVDLQSTLQYYIPTRQLLTDYQNLFNAFRKDFRSKGSPRPTRFEAKCAIFSLSQLVQSDLLLLTGLSDKNWLGNESMTWYNKYHQVIDTKK